MAIDIDTKFIMLIGTPLHQSFAARMQNAAYEAAGINMRYFYNQADSAHLAEILEGLRYMPAFRGAAITRPNKVAVLPYLDDLDPLAARMGACNTVVRDDANRLVGYNTDGIGFLTSLKVDGGIDPTGKKFFLIGAGGAGRSIASALANAGAASIVVTDVMDASAHRLVRDINANFAPVARSVRYGDFSDVADAAVVINASGIGMGETVGLTPLPPGYIRPGQFYYDACYNPRTTQFLANAAAAGCPTHNGLGMSLYQGAAQIRLWGGCEPPLDVMRAELEAIVSELEAADRYADEPAGTRAAVELLSAAHAGMATPAAAPVSGGASAPREVAR